MKKKEGKIDNLHFWCFLFIYFSFQMLINWFVNLFLLFIIIILILFKKKKKKNGRACKLHILQLARTVSHVPFDGWILMWIKPFILTFEVRVWVWYKEKKKPQPRGGEFLGLTEKAYGKRKWTARGVLRESSVEERQGGNDGVLEKRKQLWGRLKQKGRLTGG